MIWGLYSLLGASLVLNAALTRRLWQLTNDVNFMARLALKSLHRDDAGDADRLPAPGPEPW